VPNILNVIVISVLFFTIFSIIGVNYFKGSFYSCEWGSIELSLGIGQAYVKTKYDCYNLGGSWQNFD
jgi:hypothetical protein